MPTLSAVIVNYNTDEYVHRCIDSLLDNPAAGGVEVIVVDNASGDGSAEKLARRNDIRLIANSRNLGYARACNMGAAVAEGEYIIFLNPDIEVPAGGLEDLISFLKIRPARARRRLYLKARTGISRNRIGGSPPCRTPSAPGVHLFTVSGRTTR